MTKDFSDGSAAWNAPMPKDAEEAARSKAAALGIPHMFECDPWAGFGTAAALVPDRMNPFNVTA